MKKVATSKSLYLIKRLAREHVAKQKLPISLSLLLMAVSAGMTTILAKLMEPIINEAFYLGNLRELYEIAGAVVVVFAIRGWSVFGQTTLLNYAGQSIVSELQNELFRHLIWSDMAFFTRQSPGALTTRFTNDAGMLRGTVSNVLTSFGRDLISVIGLVGLMFYQDWKLACVAFVTFPIAVMPITRIGKRMRRVSHSTQHETGLLATRLDEAFQGVRQVKAHGMEAHEESRVRQAISTLFRLANKSTRIRAIANPALETLAGIAIAAVMVYGGQSVIHGGKTPGAFFSFVAAVLLAYEPMKRLSQLNAGLEEGLAAAERVFAVLDSRPVIIDSPNARPLVIRGGAIKLDDVTFTYGGEASALEHFDLEIPSGSTVALVGPSGAGKTTTFNLILRFFDPETGRVMIDGQDLRECDHGLAARRHRAGEPRQPSVRRHDRRQHPLWPAGGNAGRSPGRRHRGPCRRLHPPVAPGLRHARGPARRAAFRRPAPAYPDRAGHAARRADPAPRRGDLGPRQRVRAHRPGRAAALEARPHHRGDRPSALYRRLRRLHLRHGEGPRGRARPPRRAVGQGRRLRPALRPAIVPR